MALIRKYISSKVFFSLDDILKAVERSPEVDVVCRNYYRYIYDYVTKRQQSHRRASKKLLRKLMELELLSDYCLVGGTNLAFRYEHYPKSFSIRAFAKRPYIT